MSIRQCKDHLTAYNIFCWRPKLVWVWIFCSNKTYFNLFTDMFERHIGTSRWRPERRKVDVDDGTIRRANERSMRWRFFTFVSGHFKLKRTKKHDFDASDFFSLAHNIRPNIVSIDAIVFSFHSIVIQEFYRQTANS